MNKLLDFLESTIRYRLDLDILNQTPDYIEEPNLNELDPDLPITQFLVEHDLEYDEIIWLVMALVPHIKPGFLNEVISPYLSAGDHPQLGGVKGTNSSAFLPTCETLLFILKGHDLKERMKFNHFIRVDSILAKKDILYFSDVPLGETTMSAKLLISEDYIDLFTTGRVLKPKMGANFPAKLIETQLEWENLILQPKTLSQIQEIQTWLQYNDLVMNEWGMGSKVKPGFRVMFYGSPGTGKTLTAGLLGKYTGRDVYKIDLSLVVSKYIGETEKNLSKLFNKAADKDWILFFDEADSVFGKRTNVKDAHDKYANQEVSYLLQRIESHPGLVILASNLKNNIDTAFTRRFQSIIEFEAPGVKERLLLWQDNLPAMVPVEEDVSLPHLSRAYNLTGANIVNIVQFACLRTASDGKSTISLEHLMNGIRKEYVKEGRMM